MTEKFLLIRFEDGREGAVLEADLADEKKTDNFKGARVVSYEDGSEWDGPATPAGIARKAAAAIEARREARRERHEARAAARQAEAEVEPKSDPEPDAKDSDG